MDFYEHLNSLEQQALQRARSISAAEQRAAESFHRPVPPPVGTAPPSPAPRRHRSFESLLPGNLLPAQLFSSPDLSLIMLLFFILRSENDDPLLMLALMYILM